MSALIWGRLDHRSHPGPSSSGLSYCRCPRPAGCPTRWPASSGCASAWSSPGLEIDDRIKELRAQLERIRDQVDTEAGGDPPAAGGRAAVPARPAAAGDHREGRPRWRRRRAAGAAGDRGHDLRARPDRRRRPAPRGGGQGRPGSRAGARAAGRGRAPLATWCDRCLATVDPAPHYAVPDVERARPGAQHAGRAGGVPATDSTGRPGDGQGAGGVLRRVGPARRAR